MCQLHAIGTNYNTMGGYVTTPDISKYFFAVVAVQVFENIQENFLASLA